MASRWADLGTQLKASGIAFETEFRFHPERRWRADYRIGQWLIEVDGAVYRQGRHTRGKGFEADCEKTNEAQILGYRVLRFSTGQVASGCALDMIRRALAIPTGQAYSTSHD